MVCSFLHISSSGFILLPCSDRHNVVVAFFILTVLTTETLRKHVIGTKQLDYSWAPEGAVIICFTSGTSPMMCVEANSRRNLLMFSGILYFYQIYLQSVVGACSWYNA
jgi:hypothetical protein